MSKIMSKVEMLVFKLLRYTNLPKSNIFTSENLSVIH